MKTTTILAIALGLGSLGACNKSPTRADADNIEANAENADCHHRMNADNSADNVQAERGRIPPTHATRASRRPTSCNGADADGNSAN